MSNIISANLLILCALLASCGSRVEKTSVSRPPVRSRYYATVTETVHNHGDSNDFKIRVDAAPLGDSGGWFFVSDLATGMIVTPKPVLRWTSPNDLLVQVHTMSVEGQTVRWFGPKAKSSGSLTIRYVADQPNSG